MLDKKNMHVTGGILLKSIVGADHVYIYDVMYQHHSYARQKKTTPQKKTIITQQ